MSFNISYNFEAVDDFSPTLRKMDTAFNRLNKSVTKFSAKLHKGGAKLSKFGRNMAMKAGIPLTVFAGLAIRAAVKFQRAMNMVGADTVATTKQLETLRKAALAYGASTMFTATQVANAEMFLGRAGQDVNQIMSMLPGVLQLAASSQLDMGTASKIVIGIMKGYGMQAKELGHANNVLVKAFTSSNTDLLTLAESFKLSGPILKSAGVKFEDAAAFVAVLGNANIQATMAGTGMRKVISKLLSPNTMLKKSMKELNMTFVDAKTGQLDLLKTMKELHKHGLTTTGALTAFGLRGGNAMAALLGHYDELVKMDNELKHTGNIAERVAKAQMKGLPGATYRVVSAFQNLSIELVDAVNPALLKMMNGLARLLNKLNHSKSGLKKWIAVTIGATIVLGPLLIALGKVLIIIALLGKWGIVVNVIKGLGLAFRFMWRGILGPIGILITIGVLIYMLYKRFKIVRVIVKTIGKVFMWVFKIVKTVVVWIAKHIMDTFKPVIMMFKAIKDVGSWIWSKFHKAKPITIQHHIIHSVIPEAPTSVIGGMTPVAAGATASVSSKVMSTLNINVNDRNKLIGGITGESTADDFNMNLGTNMAMARY